MVDSFSFYFHPHQLEKASLDIAEKYKNADQAPSYLIHKKLPNLLDQIEHLQNNPDVLTTFAQGLTKVDINILASEYPYQRDNEALLEKVVFLLKARYKSLVGIRFWSHFQLLPKDKHIQSMLAYAFRTEDQNYLALKQEIREIYNIIFSREDILPQMVAYIGKSGISVKDALQEFKIQESSKLGESLWVLVLYSYIKFNWFIDTQDSYDMEERLENMHRENYKQIIFRYLDSFEFQNYHPSLLKQAILRLGDPRETDTQWKDAPGNVVSKVKKWLYQSELFEFLDGERFEYWKQYIRNINDLHVLQHPPVAAMYFDGFVVVEFKNTGNAAYFYEEEGFKRRILPKMKAGISENELKDKYSNFYIDHLRHNRNRGIPWWYDKFTDKMNRYNRIYRKN